MTYLLLILLLVFGCDSSAPVSGDTSGCPIESSCNYNPYANDESQCWYANQSCACEDGEGAIIDNCGICDTDDTNDCIQDECGEWGGNGTLDECGVCNGNGMDQDEDGICDDEDICIDADNNSICDSFDVCQDCFSATIVNVSDFEATMYFAYANSDSNENNECYNDNPIGVLDFSIDSYYLIPNIIEPEQRYCLHYNGGNFQRYYYFTALSFDYIFALHNEITINPESSLFVGPCESTQDYECLEE